MSDLNVYTTSEINALTPITGDMVVDSDLNAVKLYDGAAWRTWNSDSTAVPYQNRWGASFDGSNDYISTGLDMSGASALSVSAWVKHDSLSTAGIVTQYVGSGNRAFRLAMYPITASWAGLRLDAYNSSNTNFGTNIALNPVISSGVWYHAAFVFTGSDITVYYNGTASSTVAMTGVLASVTSNVDIGRTGTGDFMSGNIDEVAIFDSALSAADITKIYNGTAPNGKPTDLTKAASYDTDRTANLKGYWRMGDDSSDTASDGTAIATLTDSSGNGNDAVQATASSQPTFSDLTGETIYV